MIGHLFFTFISSLVKEDFYYFDRSFLSYASQTTFLLKPLDYQVAMGKER